MYCLVSPFSKTFNENGLLYFVPNFLRTKLKVGQIVEITIGEKIEIALILEIGSFEKLNYDNLKEANIKSIVGLKNSLVFLNEKQIELVRFISKYYFTQIHNALKLFIPKNLREKIQKNKTDKIFDKKNQNLNYDFNYNKKLTKKQEEIYLKILGNFGNKHINKFLLYGVTGSGKTEIYIKLIKKQLELQKQILFLIPEIILTKQLEERLEKVFGNNILVITSSISDAQKTKNWYLIYSNQAKIILGTRSALFYPYNNLGLIIIDEEHDKSYISDKSPRYNAIEVANKITEIYKNKLLLASGTPRIKTMYEALKGKYILLELLEKF